MEHPEIRSLLTTAVAEGVFPGAVYAIGRGDRQWSGAVGRHTYCPDSPAMAMDTWFDLASVSKVVSTTSLAMVALGRTLPPSPLPQGEGEFQIPSPLEGEGQGRGVTERATGNVVRRQTHGEGGLKIKVSEILPEFGVNGKQDVDLEDLLLHRSGLAAFRPFHQTLTEPEHVWEAICREAPQYERGSKTVYSDLGMIALARVLEKLGGKPLDAQWDELAKRIGIASRYRPGEGPKCAPTETVEDWRRKLWQIRGESPREMVAPDGTRLIQGEVHDPTCTVLRGVAGHAGLFSTAPDLARFCRLFLAGEIVPKEAVRTWTARRGTSSRALGWDTNWKHEQSAGKAWPEDAFGHTGYTGTSVWMHLPSDAYAILLTNRVCPTAANTKIIGFRPKFHASAARALELGAE